MIAAITLAIVLVLFFATGTIYNKSITLRNYTREAFSTMDVYLKKRWDLVPNLIEIVNSYADYEKETLSKITELRQMQYSNLNSEDKMKINNQLSNALSKLIAVSENYPDLKANQNFMELTAQLKEIETDIANSRKYYNGTVREYNTFIELFPNCIICSIFNFKNVALFEIKANERENVKVSFDK